MLPAGRQLRMQRAGIFQGLPHGAGKFAPEATRNRRRAGGSIRREDACNDRLPAVSWIILRGVNQNIRITRRPRGRRLSRVISTQSPQIQKCGPRPSLFSTTMRTMEYSTMCRRQLRHRELKGNSWVVCRLVPAFVSLASSFLPGPPADGYAANCSITRRCCSFWKSLPASVNQTSPTGGAKPLAI